MATTAVYTNLEDARNAVNDLLQAGYSADNVSLIAHDREGTYTEYVEEKAVAGEAAEGATIGALLGGIGGVLVGLGALTLPGVGPVIAAGPLAAALTGGALGAAGGAVTGAVVDALVDAGIDEERAPYYAESLRRGATVVVVDTAGMDDQVTRILRRHNAVDMDRTVETWRSRGWKGYNPDADVYDSYDYDRDFTPYR